MSDEYIHEEFEKDALFAVLSEAENLANVGGWEWDIRKNKWTFSDNWLRIHGFSKRHLETSELLKIAHPDDRPDIQKAFDKAITENAPYYEIEHRIIRQDTGEKRYVKAYGRGKLDSDGKVVKIYGAAQDITERKRAEEALQKSLTRYNELAANVPVGVYVFWIRADGRMEFEYVSDRYCEIYQLDREDVLSDFTLAFDTVHPDEREDHLASNQKAFHDRKPFIWEGRFIIGGELCWLHVESTPEVFANGDTRWFGIIQDI